MTDVDLYEMIREHANRSAIPWFVGPFNLNCWGFRSPVDLADLAAPADPFNDVIAMAYHDSRGKPILERFKATTDPGRKPLDNPTHPRGTFTLAPQRVPRFWVPGLHKGKYPALRHREGVKVKGWRGRDQKTVYDDAVGINLHHAYGSAKVGGYSEGCQVVQAEASLNRILYLYGLQKSNYPKSDALSYVLVDTEEAPMLDLVLLA